MAILIKKVKSKKKSTKRRVNSKKMNVKVEA